MKPIRWWFCYVEPPAWSLMTVPFTGFAFISGWIYGVCAFAFFVLGLPAIARADHQMTATTATTFSQSGPYTIEEES